MSTITLPNIRVSSDLTVRLRLKDGGVALDWTTLSNVKAHIYSDAQRALSGRCSVSIDGSDSTVLICQYAANKPQYLGINRIIVQCTYLGETKTYDKKAFTFVRRTWEVSGEQITIDDPDVDVEIEVQDVSSSILDEAIRAAISAADRAEAAAEAAEHMVDIHTGPEGKSAYEVAVEEGYTGTEEEWLASLVGPQGQQGIQGETGEAAGFGTVSVSLQEDGGQPSATVAASGTDTAKNFAFTFNNLKGEKGDKGDQGNSGYTGAAGELEVVNNLTDGGAAKALSAEMGKTLEGEVSQLEAKVNDISTGKYYGYYATAADLPDDATVDGFAYVGGGPTYTIYNCEGGVWTSSGITVNQSPVGNDEDIDQNADGKLQFANRVYNSIQPNGMGYKILRKNETFASQVTETNTIYEIRYDFSLSANVSIPANCELRFDGGRIVGGGNTITFDNTLISGNAKFSGCEFAGTILNGEVLLSWFTEGMSSSNDYSVDHTSVLVSAMKLASKNNNGWLNLERIPICIKQTIIITDEFGKIGMRGGEIFFVSTEDEQALFDYQERTSYSGSYSPIIDCKFTDVGDNYNTCVIKKTRWSDTAFTYWRDIRVSGFTGYFFVTNSYIQEVTFTNISVSGAGFFSTNSDGLYDGDAGSGNMIHFLNCNCNGGELNSKTSIRAIYDLSNCIEASLNNIVCQGRIGGSNIYPAYISHTSNITSGNRCNTIFDGFWVEYINGSGVINKIKCENVSACVEVRKSSTSVFDVANSNVNIIIKSAGGGYSKDILEGLTIDNTSNVTLSIDSALYGESLVPSGDYGLFKNYIDRGILRVLRNSTPPYGAGVTQTGVSISLTPENEADLMQEYVNTITKSSITSRPFIHYLSSENNIPVLTIEQVGTGNYYEFPFLTNYQNYLGGNIDTYVSRSIWQEIIYRVTVLIDVTSSNLSEVYCLTRGLTNQGGGSSDTMIEPTVGMLAGESTGWVRKAFCKIVDGYALTSGGYISMRNCKLEIARLRIARRNVSINDDVYVDSLGTLQTMRKMPRCFYMPIESASDELSEMSNIIKGGGFTVETPKNVYKYINGHLQAMLLPTGGPAGDRPTLGVNDVGKTYYDTSLGSTIIWNGTAWVNLDGTELQWIAHSVGTLTTYLIISAHTKYEGSQNYSTNALASPYLDVSGTTKIRISVSGVASASYNYGIAFYDANKAVLAGTGLSFTNQSEDNNDVREITLPAGCSFVRTCINKNISQTITFLTWVGN